MGAAARNNRVLKATDDVWSQNAWDNVVWDQDRINSAQTIVSKQSSEPVRIEVQEELNAKPASYWDKTYSTSEDRIYMDRNWLLQEFTELGEFLKPDAGPSRILEVGSGPGNTAYPLLKANQNPLLHIHAVDYSSKAIELFQSNPRYQSANVSASQWDLSSAELPGELKEASIDAITCVFVLSALHPSQWQQAMANISKLLKPNGIVLFRDFGRHDLCQLRFKKSRWMEDNLYCRGDGTRVYFFTLEEMTDLMTGHGFSIHELDYDRRLLLNRKRQVEMFRCWVQGKFRKQS